MPHTPIDFPCSAKMKNRFMLAPMTNCQSHEDGQLSDEEFHWLKMRAEGQFGIVMTCAAHVQEIGKGFPGQLGIFSDKHIPGHQRLTEAIQKEGSLALIQLHHAGLRSPKEIINTSPVAPSSIEKYDCRGLSLSEVVELKNDFVSAAKRAKQSGYDGLEIHGAHGYILSQFLSSKYNFRQDEYGGSLENRARIIFEIVNEIRQLCGDDFLLGIRLSPERFGMDLDETKWLCTKLIEEGKIDFLDISLWDCFKMPEDEQYKSKSLLEHFTELDRKDVKLTVAGKIRNAKNVQDILDSEVDFVSIGRSGILHHDFPKQVIENNEFEPVSIPVSESYLSTEGLSPNFIEYMKRWEGFVK